MSETSENHVATMPQTPFGPLKLLGQLGESPTADIAQFPPFEQIPDPFLRIEVGRIAGQALQMDTLGRSSRQEFCGLTDKVADL